MKLHEIVLIKCQRGIQISIWSAILMIGAGLRNLNFFYPSHLKPNHFLSISSSQHCGTFQWILPLSPGPSWSQKSGARESRGGRKEQGSAFMSPAGMLWFHTGFHPDLCLNFSALRMNKVKGEGLCPPFEIIWVGQDVSIVGQIMAPKICPCSVNVTLFGKRIFADVIKLKILRGDHSELFGWALNSMTSVLLRDKRQRG